MKKLVLLISLVCCVVRIAAAAERGAWVFACNKDNDLFRAVGLPLGAPRFDGADQAVASAPAGAAVLLLADGYPEKRTAIAGALLEAASRKGLRLYLEYPEDLPSLRFGGPRAAQLERAVVASEAFGPSLPRSRILALHGCTYLPIESGTLGTNLLVLAKVAGFDTAAYGLPKTTAPLLGRSAAGDFLIATTSLSRFESARYAPKPDWQVIWRRILEWLQPGADVPVPEWEMAVRPTYAREEKLPSDAVEKAIVRGIDWHTRARMLMHPSWTNEYTKHGDLANPIGPLPDPRWPSGDGECGLLEGFNSRVFADGSQNVRWWLRSDCNGESALAFALRARLDGDPRSARIAGNLLDWLYLRSGLLHADTNSPLYGLLGWAPNTKETFFQDNDIKAILGCIGTAALLGTDRWDDALVKNILANFRTTGIYCFRGEKLEGAGLLQNGWQHYWRAPTLHYSAHFEVWSWASYLWLYDKTRFAPLLERTLVGLRRMMEGYPDQWRWTNGMQQERGRMLLTLAWLVRVQDTPEHRSWLKRIATDLLESQTACGALREEMGPIHMGYMRPPRSNESYGTGEAPLIHRNGDPIADLLYTCNFSLIGLREAAAATGDPFYARAEERLIDFLVRIQVRSTRRPELDGAWFRAFDFDRWDYFASNSDWGWGAWAVECGWTQGWIPTGLALHRMKLNLWDLSRASRIAARFSEVRPWMLPESVIAVADPERKTRHAAVGTRLVFATVPDGRYPGLGERQLVDGRYADWDHTGAWLGYEGVDFSAVLDLGNSLHIGSVKLHCLHEPSMGILSPARLEVFLSDDGSRFRAVEPALGTPVSADGHKGVMLGLTGIGQTARFVKVRAVNAGPASSGPTGGSKRSWIFVDEILVNEVAPVTAPR